MTKCLYPKYLNKTFLKYNDLWINIPNAFLERGCNFFGLLFWIIYKELKRKNVSKISVLQ